MNKKNIIISLVDIYGRQTTDILLFQVYDNVDLEELQTALTNTISLVKERLPGEWTNEDIIEGIGEIEGLGLTHLSADEINLDY